MPEPLELLDRTTPRDLPPPDVGTLVARSVRRRRRERGLLVGTTAVLLVLLGAAVVVSRTGSGDSVRAVDGVHLSTDTVGRWARAADPPFSPRSQPFSGVLSDGRVLVWSGVGADGGGEASQSNLTDGGIYDPDADSWEPIAPPPLPEGLTFFHAWVADDRLAVIGRGGTHFNGAVYDVATREWTSLPRQDVLPEIVDASSWDGTTMVLIAVDPVSPIDDSEIDADLTEPVTLRWSLGDTAWQEGKPAPLGLRTGPAVADTSGRIAIYGGSAPTNSRRPGAQQDDGAIYHIADDSWTPIPAGPVPGTSSSSMVWQDGRLVLGGWWGSGDPRPGDPPENRNAAMFDPRSARWTNLPPVPTGTFTDDYGDRHDIGYQLWAPDGIALVSPDQGGGEPADHYFFNGSTWEASPFPTPFIDADVHLVDDTIAATSASTNNPGAQPFQLAFRTSAGQWQRGRPAPFVNLMLPAIEISGDRVVVVGGMHGRDIQTINDAWVFDRSG